MTSTVLEKCQNLLSQGRTRREIADELNIPYDTLRKAINDGRLSDKVVLKNDPATTKTERDKVDATAAQGLGTACTRLPERVMASVGKIDGTVTHFEPCLDVPNGGVLCALPALLANGLVDGVEQLLGQVKGFYTQLHVLLLLAFMALCRIKTVEQLRGHAPGEFGKLLGLDRIPEVRCLRKKLDDLCCGQAAAQWAAHLLSLIHI